MKRHLHLHLKKELSNYNKRCIKNNKKGFVRLNTISDYPFYKTGVMTENPDLIFIDYTKIAKRLTEKLPENYFLIFSFSGREQYTNQVRIALKTDYPVSVVFYDELPKTFLGRDVVDGNKSDLNNVLEFNKLLDYHSNKYPMKILTSLKTMGLLSIIIN